MDIIFQDIPREETRILIPPFYSYGDINYFGRISKKALVVPSLYYNYNNKRIYRCVSLFDTLNPITFPENHLLDGRTRRSRDIRRWLMKHARLEEAILYDSSIYFRLDNWFINYLRNPKIIAISFSSWLPEEVLIVNEKDLEALSGDLFAELKKKDPKLHDEFYALTF